MKKVAVVLMNLGGPTDLKAVRPFLFNLFYDRAILRLSNPWRWVLAKIISWRRTSEATEIYKNLGGKSPLLEETQNQARGLEKLLGKDFKVFVSMRYWHPFSHEAVQEVISYDPEEIVLLPLYPQFSTTTTKSSIEDFQKELQKVGWKKEATPIPCFFHLKEFLDVMEAGVRQEYARAKKYGTPRILWTAHGLPKKIIEEGDPYQWHVEKTVSYLEERLQDVGPFEGVTCYQSRVGPLEWIGPYTDDEIKSAGKERAPLVVVPIAFVSEHSETLVELDMEYKELAEESGVPFYGRVSTVRDHPEFLEGLKKLVLGAPQRKCTQCELCSEPQVRRCSSYLQSCK